MKARDGATGGQGMWSRTSAILPCTGWPAPARVFEVPPDIHVDREKVSLSERNTISQKKHNPQGTERFKVLLWVPTPRH